MERVLALVEGQTEEVFAKRLLVPHLLEHGVILTPTIVTTRRVVTGRDDKGGVPHWKHVDRDLNLLLKDSGAVAITTALDFYGLPSDSPGCLEPRGGEAPGDTVRRIERTIAEQYTDGRLSPFLFLHEFEALLYTDPEAAGDYLGSSVLTKAMVRAVDSCGSPESVNDGQHTAPSKRILGACPEYRKTTDGPAIVGDIGLDAIREACPHFNEWVEWLESLG